MLPIPATSLWSSSASPIDVRRSAARNLLDHGLDLRRVGEDVRPEAADVALVELEDGPVPEDGLGLGPAENEPGHPAPGAVSVSGENLPAPLHPEVAAQDEPVLEAQDQVLADGLDLQQRAAVEPLGDSGEPGARMRRLDVELLADEDLEVARRAVKGVAFGHTVASVCIRG